MKAEATAAVAQAAGISLITGTVLGLPLDAMVAGFSGGVVAVSLLPPLPTISARIGSVVGSTLAATFAGPAVAQFLHQNSMDAANERLFWSLLIGGSVQSLLPVGILALKRRIEQFGGIARKPGDLP